MKKKINILILLIYKFKYYLKKKIKFKVLLLFVVVVVANSALMHAYIPTSFLQNSIRYFALFFEFCIVCTRYIQLPLTDPPK